MILKNKLTGIQEKTIMKIIKSYNNTHPVLYLIATPIGNLGEFSSRAINTINEMDIIAAEDTRNSGELLAKFNLSKKLFSLREHNEVEMSQVIINEIKSGKKVAYMSDAGYPGISDPGSILVKKCIEEDIAVSVISGSSAFINALVSSTLPTDHFYFYGFLPAKENEAKKELESIKDKTETIIFYEAPHRIKDTIALLYETLGDRKASLQRELTKLNEEKIYGTLKEFLELDFNKLKGEMVIVVSGSSKEEISDETIKSRVNYLIEKGLSKKDAIEATSELFNIKKNHIKDLFN